MTDLPFHPLANIFPLLDGDAFDALVADVREHGLREAVTLHEGQILDGRNRYRACAAAGIDARIELYDGADPVAFVISKNLHRRHLSDGQRAAVAKRLANLPRHRPAGNPATWPSLSQDAAAALLNVSPRSVRRAGEVFDKGAPELIAAVERGEMRLSTAAELTTLPKARQRELVAAGKTAAAKSAHQIRTRKAARAMPAPTPSKETEHDRDLRYLRETWAATCDSARTAFLSDLGFQLRAVA